MIPPSLSSALKFAIRQGYLPRIKELIEQAKSIDEEWLVSYDLLVEALKYNQGGLVKSLLHYGAEVISKSLESPGPNILHLAVHYDEKEVVETVLRKCATINVNSVDEFGLTALHLASFYNRIEIAKVLLRYGANVNLEDSAKRTPLYFATANADVQMVDLFWKHHVVVTDPCGLLHLATKSGFLEFVKTLLENGCDVDCRDANGRTALHNTNFRIELIQMKPYRPRYVSTSCVLPYRAEVHARIAEHLLDNGADANARDIYGETPLNLACREGLIGIVGALLKHGADVNFRDRNGYTALYSSVVERNLNTSRLLLKEGASIHKSQNGSEMLLHKATRASDHEHVKLLLHYAAYVDCVYEDCTALHVAVRRNDINLVEILLDYCADVNALCGNETALHIAVQMGLPDMAKLLLTCGADVNITNQFGQTPLELARSAALRLTQFSEYSMNTFCVLAYHIKTMMTASLYVSKQNVDCLELKSLAEFCGGEDSFTIDLLTNFSLVCEKEFLSMRSMKIGVSSVSYSDILTRNMQQLVWLSANEVLVQDVSAAVHSGAFPIYGGMIWSRLKNGKRRREMEEKSKEVCFYKYFNLPDPCIDKVLGYMTDGNLQMFVNSFISEN